MNEVDIKIDKLERITDAMLRLMQTYVIQGDLITSQQACELLECSRHHLMKLTHKYDLIDHTAKGHRKYIYRKVMELIPCK